MMYKAFIHRDVWHSVIFVFEQCYGQTKKLNTSIKIKGVDIVNKNLIVWNGKKAEVHEILDGILKGVDIMNKNLIVWNGKNMGC